MGNFNGNAPAFKFPKKAKDRTLKHYFQSLVMTGTSYDVTDCEIKMSLNFTTNATHSFTGDG
jgi:hypothetical protein